MKLARFLPLIAPALLIAGLALAQSHAYGVGEASFQNTGTVVAATATSTAIGSVSVAYNPRAYGPAPVVCWGTISWHNTSASTATVTLKSSLGANTAKATIAAGGTGCLPFLQDGSLTAGTSPLSVALIYTTDQAGSIDPRLAELICAAFPQ